MDFKDEDTVVFAGGQPTTGSKYDGVKPGGHRPCSTDVDSRLAAVCLELTGGKKSEFRQALRNTGT